MSDKEKCDVYRKTNRSRDSRHSKYESRNGSNHSSDRNDRFDRNDRHRRHEDKDRSNRDSNQRFKRNDYSSGEYDSSDRRDNQRRDHRSGRRHSNRSRSRSRSRERDRHSANLSSGSKREENTSRTKSQSSNETLVCDNKEKEKGVQHKSSLEIMRQQIRIKTGIDVPEYYNPGAINPIKFAEQERKRKMLWSKEEPKPKEEKVVKSSSTSNLWNSLKFEGEKGNEMTEKFRKLMGIKDKSLNSSALNSGHNESAIESQKTLFRNLDMQYSVARLSAHTQRGVGLGFGGAQNYSSSTAGPQSNDHK